MWQLTVGDLAYWLDDDRHPVRCRVELVTDTRAYLRATASEHGRRKGEVWFEGRFTRRVAPRPALYIHEGKGHFDWSRVRFAA
ncbi:MULTISPECIES: hypothetical protein [unclassified Micromonospora]|uniref:hypothetical protein n=1 Tax=unclassified Micromonospora TaxID=2617518 RepID=UPI0033BE80DD